MPHVENILWLIPALPLLAAALGAAFTQRSKKLSAGAALLGMAGAFAVSCAALAQVLANPTERFVSNFSWITLGAGDAPFADFKLGFLLDGMTATMCVMVTFVGFLIFLFSTGYMKDDENSGKFFCYLSFFAAAMLGIVVSNSILLTFISWELVGLASYLLIGFWFTRPAAAAAAKKAFITTRIGDLGFLLGIVWLNSKTGTLLFYDNGAGFLEAGALQTLAAPLAGGMLISTAIGLLIFCGAVGKSGQFPLHVWLPDAMEGPTPVSALIHAATMVAAGVFLIARIFPLMNLDLIVGGASCHALTVVAYIGAITALLGAVVAVAQNDIKRILAFSTVSQLGYMMLAIGVGVWPAAIFHLLTHAFFKALLFLGAGSVIHAAHHEQDIRRLGGLSGKMKITFATFSVGMMALAGVPFFFSGFWSKEAILHGADHWGVSEIPFYVALVAVVLTAFYMTRLMCNVFAGKPRTHEAEHAHENSWVMTLPLALLAVCAVVVGFFNTPAWPWLDAILTGKNVAGFDFGKIFEGGALMWTSIALVAIGIGIGFALYGAVKRKTAAEKDPLEKATPAVWAALENRLYFDEIYAATFGRLNAGLAIFADCLDRRVIAGTVRFVALLCEFFGFINRDNDETVLNGGFNDAGRGLRARARIWSALQTGDAHGSLRWIALGFAAIAVLIALGGAL